MEKNFAAGFSNTGGNSNSRSSGSSSYRNHFLNHLNKSSHKIFKPQSYHLNHQRQAPLTINDQQLQPQQSSGVYNVDKKDFRSVVQKLTGSSSHDRFSAPSFPTPQISRLQRIRPPPLATIRPPFVLPPPPTDAFAGIYDRRPASPLPPLPPFPPVFPAAESPVSTYLRRLESSTADANLLWNAIASCSPHLPPSQPPLPQLPEYSFSAAAESPFPPSPEMPLDFAHIPLMSPGVLLSPTTSQLGFPLPPLSPVPSPSWNDL